ncbi:hypothetical protein D3C72_1459970 [compost metagenome]
MFRHHRHLQAKEILHLHGSNGDGDTGGKAQRHRQGNVLNQAAETRQSHDDQKQSGKQGGDQQAREAELLRHRIEDHHKRGGRPGDAVARAAADGNDNPGNRRRIESILGGNAAGNCQCHCQRDGDNTDGDAGDGIF